MHNAKEKIEQQEINDNLEQQAQSHYIKNYSLIMLNKMMPEQLAILVLLLEAVHLQKLNLARKHGVRYSMDNPERFIYQQVEVRFSW